MPRSVLYGLLVVATWTTPMRAHDPSGVGRGTGLGVEASVALAVSYCSALATIEEVERCCLPPRQPLDAESAPVDFVPHGPAEVRTTRVIDARAPLGLVLVVLERERTRPASEWVVAVTEEGSLHRLRGFSKSDQLDLLARARVRTESDLDLVIRAHVAARYPSGSVVVADEQGAQAAVAAAASAAETSDGEVDLQAIEARCRPPRIERAENGGWTATFCVRDALGASSFSESMHFGDDGLVASHREPLFERPVVRY